MTEKKLGKPVPTYQDVFRLTEAEIKKLGQIAYEAAAEFNGDVRPWSQVNQETWDVAANAVAKNMLSMTKQNASIGAGMGNRMPEQLITADPTPFKFSFEPGDLSHSFVVGPSGQGMSVALVDKSMPSLLLVMAAIRQHAQVAEALAFVLSGGDAAEWHLGVIQKINDSIEHIAQYYEEGILEGHHLNLMLEGLATIVERDIEALNSTRLSYPSALQINELRLNLVA